MKYTIKQTVSLSPPADEDFVREEIENDSWINETDSEDDDRSEPTTWEDCPLTVVF